MNFEIQEKERKWNEGGERERNWDEKNMGINVGERKRETKMKKKKNEVGVRERENFKTFFF